MNDRFMHLVQHHAGGKLQPILLDRLVKRQHSPGWKTQSEETASVWLIRKQDDIEAAEFVAEMEAENQNCGR